MKEDTMPPEKLFTPGPTAVPWQVLETMSRPLIHHRTAEFREIHREAADNLKYVYRTKNPVVILTASGSGAMESAVVNLTRVGEKAIVIEVGKFSERWRELGEAYGLDLVVLKAEWGDPINPDQVAKAFEENPGVGTVFVTHCETSTGVLQDVKTIARIAHENGALIAVDGITSLCAQNVQTDDWGLDAVVGGSQKGFMTPPGLSFISLSENALERMEAGRHPVFYFDLLKAVKSLEKDDTPYTPAHTVIIALNEALRMIKQEGLENVIRRHTRNAKATRAAVKALGLKLFSSMPCNATTAVLPPDGTADKIRSHMVEKHGVRIAGGQGPVKGKIIRLGHLGYYHDADVVAMISALESTLIELGLSDKPGRGIEALLQSFADE